MGDILFLAHRVPFPPDRGDKIRSHHILKALAKIAPVHVATFADDEEDGLHEGELASLAASYCLVRRSKPLALAAIEALAAGEAVSLAAFRDRRLQDYVDRLASAGRIGAIYVFSGQMAQYVPAGFRGRVIADLVDVDSAKFEAYGLRGKGPRAWIDRREGRLLSREEARIAHTASMTLLVSEPEAALLRSRMPAAAAAVRALGNGIDFETFDPARVVPEPRMLAAGSPRIVFTGQMDYAPNLEAVERAIDRILPLVRRRLPDASFHVVGRNPPAALKARDGRDGIAVWGRVEDIRPWLAASDIALIPLEIARGVQNKVLEAMAMALPVVLSPGAATGIDARDRRDFLIAETDEGLAEAVIALAGDGERSSGMGRSARAWIVRNAGWDTALAPLPAYLGLDAPGLSDAA